MAEALKNQYGPEVVQWLAQQIHTVYPQFDKAGYCEDVLVEFETLELMPRGKHMALCLKPYLPASYSQAIDILVRSMGVKLQDSRSFDITAFYYLPYSFYISEYGLDHFEESMVAQYELTQRFTAEFCIRSFLLKHPERTLARLHDWLNDPSEHVRRLVSEGTRPRLPWGIALKPFKQNPAPVLELLEALKDDESLYVRRSVANNLNDIGKDNLDVLCAVCTRWLNNADNNRQWLVNHALRSAIKRAEPAAFRVLGYGPDINVSVKTIAIEPAQSVTGDNLQIAFRVTNKAEQTQPLLVDCVIHYVKANGSTNPKVFKLKTLQLQPGEFANFSKKISLRNMSTRKHYSGIHKVEALLNGVRFELGEFILQV